MREGMGCIHGDGNNDLIDIFVKIAAENFSLIRGDFFVGFKKYPLFLQ